MILRDPPQIPILLERKEVPKKNLVLGLDEEQILFLKREVYRAHGSVEVENKSSLKDEDVYKESRVIIWICHSDQGLEISEDIYKKIGFWSNKPITKRSAAINAIIRTAAQVVGIDKLEKETINNIGDWLLYRDRNDIDGLFYEAGTKLLGYQAPANGAKKIPKIWESPWAWIGPGDDLGLKLYYLYQDLVWYTYSRTDEWPRAKSTGCSSSRFQWLKSLNFKVYRLEESLRVLSSWKAQKIDNEIAVLHLSLIWSS